MQLITYFQTCIRQLLLMGVMLAVAGITALEAQTISVTNFYHEGSDLTPKQNPVEDQNGSRCALIRVQTTQKGFTFDVGSLGITKIEDDHDSEIWLWVPYGVRHISIRHEYLGSLPKYEFPIRIQKASSYIMTIATDQQFINNFDKDRKQWLKVSVKAPNAQFTLNGMRVALDKKGCTEQEVHLGVHTYKVEAENFYPKEGQVSIVDPDKPTELVIDDLKPIMSKLNLHVNPVDAQIVLDGKPLHRVNRDPFEIQTGKHTITVSRDSYRSETVEFVVQNDIMANVDVNLSQLAKYHITANTTAYVEIDGKSVGFTPADTTLTSGRYRIKATRNGYKPIDEWRDFNSSNPQIQLHMKKIYNFENELYVEGNGIAGNLMGAGASVGLYVHKIHIEGGWFKGFSPTEYLYLNYPDVYPTELDMRVNWWLTCKAGYGFPIATRFRLTPQVGAGLIRFSCGSYIADGTSAWQALCGVRFSGALSNVVALSVTPEYAIPVKKSAAVEATSDFSSTIHNWIGGFRVKCGIAVYF